MPGDADGAIKGRVNGVLRRRVHGWAWRPDHPDDHVRLDVFAEGVLVGIGLADQASAALARRNIGRGDHAFSVGCSVAFSPGTLQGIEVVALTPEGRAVALAKAELD